MTDDRADGRTALALERTALARIGKFAGVAAVALLTANCGVQNHVAQGGGKNRVDPKYGVAASPRLVAEGQAVPKGGGRELVGRPYKIAGRTYVPREAPNYSRVGTASWYGSAFHGRMTANGEIFDRHSIAAAHPTMPLPSYARVTNLTNGRSMIVRVNDRGPYHGNRVVDVSEKVAEALAFKHAGVARVRVDYVGRASTRGSDDRRLLASLRMDGAPATLPGSTAPVMVASAEREAPRGLAGLFASAEPAPRAQAAPGPLQSFAVAQALAQPEPAPSVPTMQVASAAPVSMPVGRVVSGIPLPPERPFDLGTIPNAGTPVAVAPVGMPQRAVVASLFYAAPERPAALDRADPFSRLKPQRFVPLKATP
jgi:rare lipoprotein A